MSSQEYKFSLNKINHHKVFKTIRGAIKKAYFYLGLNLSYSKTEELIIINETIKDSSSLKLKLGELFDIFVIAAKIRHYDDILDNVLAKQKPIPLDEMKKVVSMFEEDINKEYGDVSNLFRKEIDLIENSKKYSTKIIQERIREIISIRPSDYFLLIDQLIKKFGTSLSSKDYNISLEFYKEFQVLRDLLDDLMSVEEDILKNDYNSVVLAHKRGISYHFFDSIVRDKIERLKCLVTGLSNHPNHSLFYETITFWELEYRKLFKPLLTSFYIGLDEFRKIYFMIKQL